LLKNSKKNFGLFVSKLALLGNEDAAQAVQWMMDKLYPESVFTERETDVKKQENDLAIPYFRTVFAGRFPGGQIRNCKSI
jgi:hypothetical protein